MTESSAERLNREELLTLTQSCQEAVLARAKAGEKLPFDIETGIMGIQYVDGIIKSEEELGSVPTRYCWYVEQKGKGGQLATLSTKDWQRIKANPDIIAQEIPVIVGNQWPLDEKGALQFFKLIANQGRIINAWVFSRN